MDTKELLKKRRMLKAKKPEFVRQDAHKKKKVGWKWRKPRGSDSKMRVSRRGYKRLVKKGWGSPSAVKGTDRSGLLPVIVNNLSELKKLDPSKHIMVLSGGLGTKKKTAIVEEAVKKKIKISNCKDPQKFLSEVKEQFDKRKKDKEKLKAERTKKKEDAKKEAAKKEKKEQEKKKEEEKKSKEGKEKTPEELKDEEERKIEEKKERDKLLISTQ